MGRPPGLEGLRRQRELVRLLQAGVPFLVASSESRVNPATILNLIDERPEFGAFVVSVLERRVGAAVAA